MSSLSCLDFPHPSVSLHGIASLFSILPTRAAAQVEDQLDHLLKDSAKSEDGKAFAAQSKKRREYNSSLAHTAQPCVRLSRAHRHLRTDAFKDRQPQGPRWNRAHPMRDGLLPPVDKVRAPAANGAAVPLCLFRATLPPTDLWRVQETRMVLGEALCNGLFHNVAKIAEGQGYFRTMEGWFSIRRHVLLSLRRCV